MATKNKLPRKWGGSYTDVGSLTDEDRRTMGLSHEDSIIEVVGDLALGREALKYAYEQGVVAFDTETSGLDPLSDRIILLQIGDEERQYLIWWETMPEAFRTEFQYFLAHGPTRKVGFNLKFDVSMFLGQQGLHWRANGLLDCQLLEQILNCGLTGDIGQTMKMTGMGPTALRWLGWMLPKNVEIRTGWELMTPGKWYPTLPEVLAAGGTAEDFERAKAKGIAKRHYAADDCVVPMRVLNKQIPWITELGLTSTAKLEMEFLSDLSEMEVRGLRLDWPRWEALIREAEEGQRVAEAQLDALFDVTVITRTDLAGNVEKTRDKNYNSTEELRDLVREWMWRTYEIDVIACNKHLKESLIRVGMPEIRAEKKIAKKLVPNPANPDKRKQVGYPGMTDYLTGSEHTENLFDAYRSKLPKHVVLLTDTDSKTLKLYRILNETPAKKIDSGLPTKIGLPAEIVDPILKLRETTTKLERYAWGWKDLVHPVTGRVHTDTTQCAADTGRLTTRPNFQNVPSDQRYRECFRAAPGFKIVGADFSQIEPRIIAQLSLCRTYMRVFWSEKPGSKGFDYWCGDDVTEPLDLYGTIGAAIGVLPPEAEQKSVAKLPESAKGRKKAKIAVLGLGYGTGKDKFHVQYLLDIGEYHKRAEADALWNGFWEVAQEVKATLDELSTQADPSKSSRRCWHPFVEDRITWSESLGGRRRFFDRNSPQWWTQGRNHPIQSTGADILKQTCVDLSRWMRLNKIDGGLILTAHDELLAEVRTEQAQAVADQMEVLMSEVGQRYCPNVPVTAGAYVEDYWLKD
jgi:DNA polymerase I-like protein with 3'-5' exonuclease and polymerase domains